MYQESYNEIDVQATDDQYYDLNQFRYLNPRLMPSKRRGLFDHFLALAEGLYSSVFAAAAPNRMRQWKMLALINILINLYMAYNAGEVLAYSRQSELYSSIHQRYGYNWYSYNSYRNIFDQLLTMDYIYGENGYFDRQNNEGRRARAWVADPLIEKFSEIQEADFAKERIVKPLLTNSDNQIMILEDYDPVYRVKPNNLIILKDDKKRWINYNLTKQVRLMLKKLKHYNDLMEHTELLLPIEECSYSGELLGRERLDVSLPEGELIKRMSSGQAVVGERNYYQVPGVTITGIVPPNPLYYNKLDANLYRVFNRGSFNYGGRYYDGDYQSIPSKRRKRLLMNGSTVEEIDFSSLHIRMLYHQLGAECASDPYDIFSNECLRKAVKLIMNIAVNARSSYGAICSFDKEFSLGRYSKKDVAPENLAIRETLLENDLDGRSLFKKVFEKHTKIQKYICSDQGIHLQNIDSQIATDVMEHFTKQDIPCLCVHDSFIVEQAKAQELSDVMQDKYSKHNNGFNCPVSTK